VTLYVLFTSHSSLATDTYISWGESAGANGVGFQMVLKNGNTENLFRAAVLESGSAFPPGNVTDAQPFACLGTVDSANLTTAVNLSPSFFQSIVFAWQPRVDGTLLTDTPLHLINTGKVAKIPFISGDLDDEGT
jgi:carboxylesterase type B